MTFLASVFLMPLAIGFVGITLAEAGFPYLILVALVLIPVAGTYLLLVTKLHLAVRIFLAATFCYALLSAFQPKTTCKGYEDQEKAADIVGSKITGQERCS